MNLSVCMFVECVCVWTLQSNCNGSYHFTPAVTLLHTRLKRAGDLKHMFTSYLSRPRGTHWKVNTKCLIETNLEHKAALKINFN